MEKEKKHNYAMVLVKGCAMGAADVIPGVSGGTIAFITGIYETLLDSIRAFDLTALKLFVRGRWREWWRKVNGSFLFSLLAGIGISIFSLAKLMTWLLENHPVGVWSFFFGLIIASSVLVAREIKRWNVWSVVSGIIGIVVAYYITVVTPTETPDTWWFIILSGAIAICAMILPGISGSFILLLMGKYLFIMEAVHELRIGVLALFAVGAVAGIISFSHVLSWLLKNYHNVTVSLLTGFMVGSLNKVWPWKETLATSVNGEGMVVPVMERNVSPAAFEELTTILPSAENGRLIVSEVPLEMGHLPAVESEALLPLAIGMCAAGFLLIVVIELVGKRMQKAA